MYVHEFSVGFIDCYTYLKVLDDVYKCKYRTESDSLPIVLVDQSFHQTDMTQTVILRVVVKGITDHK